MESNIFSIDQRRRLHKLKEKEQVFKSYISKLKQENLQSEADFIINNIEKNELTEEFLLKSALLMDELAKRIDTHEMSYKISQLSKDLKSKMATLFKE